MPLVTFNRALMLTPPPTALKSSSYGAIVCRNTRNTPPTSTCRGLTGLKATLVTMSGIRLGTLSSSAPVLYWASISLAQHVGNVTNPFPSCCSGFSTDAAQLKRLEGRHVTRT